MLVACSFFIGPASQTRLLLFSTVFSIHASRPHLGSRRVFCGVAGWYSKKKKMFSKQYPNHRHSNILSYTKYTMATILALHIWRPSTCPSTFFILLNFQSFIWQPNKKQIKCWEWHEVGITQNSTANLERVSEFNFRHRNTNLVS